MAFAHYLVAVPVKPSNPTKTSILSSSLSSSSNGSLFSLTFSSTSSSSSSLKSKARKLSIFPKLRKIGHKAKAKPQESEVNSATDAFTQFKHLLLPITDRNPYLSEGTRQAAATTAALAKKYGADITVVGNRTLCSLQLLMRSRKHHCRNMTPNSLASVGIFLKEAGNGQYLLSNLRGSVDKFTRIKKYNGRFSSIPEFSPSRLYAGGFQEFKLLERLGEGNKPTAIIGEVADDLHLDLVVISMEAIHSKHVDANLLAEFIPCPVLLLPL